jgi:hypothetical protein
MKTVPIGAPRGLRGPRRRANAGAGEVDFSDLLGAQQTPRAEATSASAASFGIDALLGLQEVSDEHPRRSRRQALARGNDILDRLERLKLDILSGRVPPNALRELSEMVRQTRQGVDDETVAAVLDEIRLRAEVELAKIARSS